MLAFVFGLFFGLFVSSIFFYFDIRNFKREKLKEIEQFKERYSEE